MHILKDSPFPSRFIIFRAKCFPVEGTGPIDEEEDMFVTFTAEEAAAALGVIPHHDTRKVSHPRA